MNSSELPEDEHSVTVLLQQAKGGDEAAAYEIWERYFKRIVALASRRLPDGVGRVVGPEDIASSALDCLLRGAKEGRFRKLEDRDDLWQVLTVIAVRRACNVIRDAGRHEKGESRLAKDPDDLRQGIAAMIDKTPTPESLVTMQDTFEDLMENLDDQMRSIVRFRLAGYTHAEIAAKLNIVTRTVERKLALIRSTWATRSAL